MHFLGEIAPPNPALLHRALFLVSIKEDGFRLRAGRREIAAGDRHTRMGDG